MLVQRADADRRQRDRRRHEAGVITAEIDLVPDDAPDAQEQDFHETMDDVDVQPLASRGNLDVAAAAPVAPSVMAWRGGSIS